MINFITLDIPNCSPKAQYLRLNQFCLGPSVCRSSIVKFLLASFTDSLLHWMFVPAPLCILEFVLHVVFWAPAEHLWACSQILSDGQILILLSCSHGLFLSPWVPRRRSFSENKQANSFIWDWTYCTSLASYSMLKQIYHWVHGNSSLFRS